MIIPYKGKKYRVLRADFESAKTAQTPNPIDYLIRAKYAVRIQPRIKPRIKPKK